MLQLDMVCGGGSGYQLPIPFIRPIRHYSFKQYSGVKAVSVLHPLSRPDRRVTLQKLQRLESSDNAMLRACGLAFDSLVCK